MEKIRIIGGHTRMGGGTRVQIGATSRMTIEADVSSVHGADILAWLDAQRGLFTDAHLSLIKQDINNDNIARAMLGAAGALTQGGDYEALQDAQDIELSAETQEQNDFFNALKHLKNTPHKISGDVAITGQTMQPSTAAIFFRVVKFVKADGTNLTFIDLLKPVTASPSGTPISTQLSVTKHFKRHF